MGAENRMFSFSFLLFLFSPVSKAVFHQQKVVSPKNRLLLAGSLRDIFHQQSLWDKDSKSLGSKDILQRAVSRKKIAQKSLSSGYIKPFPLIYRPEVKRWIHFFSQSSSPYFKLWLKRSYRYFPLMEGIFQAKGLPKELVYMSLVESSLSSKAVSSAQAVGYWQFIEPTALRFGLRVNHWIDERRDFQKSAQAASQYLYQLYKEFGDWLLAMSAYNMGEGRLRKLIKKHQTKNFWLLYKKSDFPQETALYVPKILAAAHIVQKPEIYGLSAFSVLEPYSYDIFFTPGGTNLKQMFRGAKIPVKKIKALNPDLKTYTIPSSISFHQIRIPKGAGLLISKWLDKQQKSP